VGVYWFLAATLRAPAFGAPPPLPAPEFIELCRRHLSAADLRVVEAARLLSDPAEAPAACVGSAVLRRYYAWERSMRNELARLRARRRGTSAEPWLRASDGDGEAQQAAAIVFQCRTPLEAELELERRRWALLESIGRPYPIDRDGLAVYGLKLQLLERLQRLRADRGEPRYRETYQSIIAAAAAGGDQT
jgi:hypothetical protein